MIATKLPAYIKIFEDFPKRHWLGQAAMLVIRPLFAVLAAPRAVERRRA
jgi:hypothetical protein